MFYSVSTARKKEKKKSPHKRKPRGRRPAGVEEMGMALKQSTEKKKTQGSGTVVGDNSSLNMNKGGEDITKRGDSKGFPEWGPENVCVEEKKWGAPFQRGAESGGGGGVGGKTRVFSF